MKSYPMTDTSFGARLETFKANVDGSINALLDTHVSLKRVGGLYHWRVGRLGGSLYVKRKVAPKVKQVVETPVAPSETTIPNWQTRILIGTRQN